jgi:uncharacterized protein
MSYGKPLPRIDALNRPFWEAARKGSLIIQCCNACGDVRFPPSPICPKCLSREQSWREASGRGTLESWVDFHRAYWDGFRDDLPYRVCLVRLAEGPLLVSNLVGNSGAVRVGAPMQVVFDRVTGEVTLPRFELVAKAAERSTKGHE